MFPTVPNDFGQLVLKSLPNLSGRTFPNISNKPFGLGVCILPVRLYPKRPEIQEKITQLISGHTGGDQHCTPKDDEFYESIESSLVPDDFRSIFDLKKDAARS